MRHEDAAGILVIRTSRGAISNLAHVRIDFLFLMIKDTKTKSVTEVSLERLCLTVCVFITGN